MGQVILNDIQEMGDCEPLMASAVQRRVATYLADRSLIPALRRLGMKPLVGRSIGDMLDPNSREPLVRLFRDNPRLLRWWFELLLGPEGHAARVLNLAK